VLVGLLPCLRVKLLRSSIDVGTNARGLETRCFLNRPLHGVEPSLPLTRCAVGL
jgi:hypothetical protein